MFTFDWGFIKNSTLIINPIKGDKPFEMDDKTFHYSFANTMTIDESNEAWNKYATHDSRNVLRDCLGNAGKVDLDLPHNPLLFIGGEKDQIIPPDLNEKNAKANKDKASISQFKEFPNRGHFICGQSGWEEVATYTYEWLKANVD